MDIKISINTIANYASVKSLMERVNSVNTVRVRVPSGSRVLRKYLLSLYSLNYLFIIYFPRQGPRLTLKKVRRENEVPKKWDFNFGGRYLSQMSLFSPKWVIFGITHAWIFRINWETEKRFTYIVAVTYSWVRVIYMVGYDDHKLKLSLVDRSLMICDVPSINCDSICIFWHFPRWPFCVKSSLTPVLVTNDMRCTIYCDSI